MPGPQHRRLVVGGGVALALIGLWLGHTVEYLRVWGTAGLDAELFGSIHAYMLPLAAVIGLLASAAGFQLWRAWTALGRRLDAARALVRALLRGKPGEVPDTPAGDAAPSFWAGIGVAWPALALLQIGLYLLQENIEAVAGGVPAPGLGAVTGVHALAPLVHAGISLILLIAAAATLRLLRRRATSIDVVEAIARALLRALTTRAPRLAAPPSREVTAPLFLLGLGLRQRPPPQLLTV